jgi:hypothetical protein
VDIKLPSGLTLRNCESRLLDFCENEYAYYDGIQDADPSRVLPIDVLATISMNSRVSTGAKVQAVHVGMARACDGLLSEIPTDADLLVFDPDLTIGEKLLSSAMLERGVGPAVATKVLHRKRRSYIPMLDNVVIVFYLDALDVRKSMEWRLYDKTRAVEPTMSAWRQFREDLGAVASTVDELRRVIETKGCPMTRVRALEALIWIEAEPLGHYR